MWQTWQCDSEQIVYTLVIQSDSTEAFLIAITFCKIFLSL